MVEKRTEKEKRTNFIAVRLTDAELSSVDSARGKMTRAAAVRHLALAQMPAPVPAINLHAWVDLGRALGNLATLAGMSRSGQFVDVGKAREAVAALRAALVGASAGG